ncbi:inositol monophosphatase family protein [Pseudonocardia spinosispora]|uniref:inositol monophosphatase family protein n=1 Tax=Pseudonocardia spinosispora TaxID=103441 RepID=UPI00048B410C|nr:inositol monophosphatase family protein [Pseudonocardia spinosispora]
MTVLYSPPVDPGLLSRALEVGGRLANDAAEVISATADRGCRVDPAIRSHPFDWVTDTGRTLERHTRRVLAAEFPDIAVAGAQYEPPVPSGSEFRWVVAPLDGTANYLAGLPWFSYSLALLDSAGPVVGVISNPSQAEVYAAARGRGTRVNGVPVRISEQATAHGYPVCVERGSGHWPTRLIELADAAGCGVRVLGSAALAISQVALGHAVAAVLEDYREWDVAAGLALALEAGAVVLDRDGRPDPLPANGALVAAPAAADEVLSWWGA